MKREFLQLCKKYRPGIDKVGGWYLSEKLDGTRCFWDGGLSRGLPTHKVPWASVLDPKTGLRKAKIKPVATGLWSRYGNPIMAPAWFLDQLPPIFLDGELWAGRGQFQLCRSICGGDNPDPRFTQIKFAVYSSPPLKLLFQDGTISNTNMLVEVDLDTVEKWCELQVRERDLDVGHLGPTAVFSNEVFRLGQELAACEHVYLHRQIVLPADHAKAREAVEEHLSAALEKGGEGVVIRDPQAGYLPKRTGALLKYKPFSDAEARIIGFTSGRETAKGSKHLGKIGALITDYEGKRLELAGLTDAEREFATQEMAVYASRNPGVDMPQHFKGKQFRIGQMVTFLYRELSDDGIPREARYWRRRDVE